MAPAYSDMTYLPSGVERPNARLISNEILAGESGLPSYKNRTVMFAFFGNLKLLTSIFFLTLRAYLTY